MQDLGQLQCQGNYNAGAASMGINPGICLFRIWKSAKIMWLLHKLGKDTAGACIVLCNSSYLDGSHF